MIPSSTIDDLITAFSYKLSMDRAFYWKKETNRLVEVSLLDYSLLSECKADYTSGLDQEGEREVKEAIIAITKERNTHLLIPRLTKDERINLMNDFIKVQKSDTIKIALQNTLDELITLSMDKSMIASFRKGYAFGFDLDNLILHTPELANDWKAFYRSELKQTVEAWLETNASR